MQKIGLVVLAMLLAMLLAACGGDGAPAGQGLFVVIIPTEAEVYYKAEADAVRAQAQALGYQTLVLEHQGDAGLQEQHIETAIARKADALIVHHAHPQASIGSLQRAKDAGIPGFVIDQELNAAGVAVAQIIIDTEACAQAGAVVFAGLMDEQGAYIELRGPSTEPSAEARSRGFNDVLRDYGAMQRVAQPRAGWSREEAYAQVEALLQVNPAVRGVLAGNDAMALGAADALRDAGVALPVVVGFGGSPEALAAIRSDQINATVLQPAAEIAAMAVAQADVFVRTGQISQPERQVVACETVTLENVERFGVFARNR